MITANEFRAILLGAALLCMSGRAAADTIVLKNGRRIIALSAIEEGDKVKYVTSAGELSLPMSIVDHIEKGGMVSMAEGVFEMGHWPHLEAWAARLKAMPGFALPYDLIPSKDREFPAAPHYSPK